MYWAGTGHPDMSSSSRSKESSSSGSRSSRSGASTSSSGRGRSPRRSRSPSPRGRRHRSPSSSRSSRRSPSPRRRSRRRSPGRRSRSPGRRSRSPRRRSRSPGRRSRSPGRRSRSPGRRSRSPGRRSRSPGRRSRSPGRCSRSPERRSPSRNSESSVEQSLRITVGNDRYGFDTPERKRLSDRLGSPVDSLSDVDRDDLADGPIFSRRLSRSRSIERYPSCEENASSPYHMIRHDKDYRSRDVFIHKPDYGVSYDHLQEQSRETDRDGEPVRKSLYSSEDRGRELKRARYDRDERSIDMSTETQGFLPGTRNYRKRSLSRSPSPPYLDEEFRELENARRKKKEEALGRNLNRELSGNGYMVPSSTSTIQSTEPRYLYRPDEAPAMPKKSILKKRVDDPSVQPDVFSKTSVKEPPLLSDPPPSPQHSTLAPFALEVENFLKQFNKNAVAELAANKESKSAGHDWRPYSDQNQSSFPFSQNSGNFLTPKEHTELTSEPVDWQNDFLLPHERASQDGSGFSRILGMMADSTQEKRRRSLPDDIEDEEKFLYGDYEDDSDTNSPCAPKVAQNAGKEPVRQKANSPPPPLPSVKADISEEPRPEYEKIHDLLKTIGLDIGVAEIGKLAARTQERLHGKKPSRSPDHHVVSSHKPESQERRRSRSNTLSPESSRKHSLSPPGSFPQSKDMSSLSKSDHKTHKTLRQDNSSSTPEGTVPPIPVIPSAPPSLSNLSPPTSVSQYNVSHFPPFTATQLPQNYPSPTMPPPGYDAYGHYMAYAASGWPMYAQQADPALSDIHGLVPLPVPPNPTRPNLRVIETVSTGRGAPDIKRDDSLRMQLPSATPYLKVLPQYPQPPFENSKERVSDERNRASQKQKVMEEREKLKAEQEARQKKLHYLKTELNRLSKQQGEMLRKKRREKDGHKDPLLVEVNRLQENIMKEITQLKMSVDAAEKKQSELDKVAQILGINIFEKSRKPSSENKDSSEKNKSENAKTQERTSSSIKESRATGDKPKDKSPKPTDSSSPSSKHHHQEGSIYNYYDAGNHWCKDCNTICGTMFDFFTHLHNKKHRQTLDPYNRPWTKTENETKQEVVKHIDKIPVPAKGSEFLIPVTGYYCQICHEFFGDQISAEQHVKSHPHNEKYKKHIDENPLYEERRNLDRQAGLSVIQETERRLKRKQCEKQKEEKDEKIVKVARREEPNTIKELEDGDNDHDINKKDEIPNGQKCGIKLRLKKYDKEVEKKEGKTEESPKDSRLSSFGKFSWRKTEKDEKSQGKDVAAPKEESVEECKDKESKSQPAKSNSKPIAIKLSGKTVIPHTSPWTPVVSTPSQSKIRPNLPVPTMVLRKSATATVSKPAPLNTFLSIKSSGATTKPLPVVKEGSSEIVLPPDIISKAFGGEVVVLKGSQENAKLPEQAEEQEQESVTKALDHAKALEHAKASAVKAQEQAAVMANAQAKARELAAKAKEQEIIRMALINESLIYDRSRRPPLLQLPPRPPLALTRPLPPPPPPPPPPFSPSPLLPANQTVILADDMAPGVSEDDKNILAMPMCPRPLPPPTIFRDHVKKLEKKNTSLAAGNAQDLYDIFYNSSGRSPADSKPVSSATSDKGKLNPVERGQNTDQLLDSKPSNNVLPQESLCNVYSSSDVSKLPLNDRTLEKEEVKVEKRSAVWDENVECKTIGDGESGKVSFSDTESTSGYLETSELNDLPASASAFFQKKEEINGFSKKSPQLEKAELDMQLSEINTFSLEDDSKKASELEETEHLSFDINKLAVQFSDSVASLEGVSKEPLKSEMSEFVLQFSESSAPSLEDNKKPSELETTECKSPGDKKSTVQLLEHTVTSLEDLTKKPLKLKTPELVMQVSGSSSIQLEEHDKNRLALETAKDKLILQLFEESTGPLEDAIEKPSEQQTQGLNSPHDQELTGQLPDESIDFTDNSVVTRDIAVTGNKDMNEKPQNQQKYEVYAKSKLNEVENDLEMKAYVANLTERDVGRNPPELVGYDFAGSKGEDSESFETHTETKGEGPVVAAENLLALSSELTISTWVSDMHVQSQQVWESIDSSSKTNEEDPQMVVTDQSSSGSTLDLTLGTGGFQRLESGTSEEIPQHSKIQNTDAELRLLNEGELDSFHVNNERELLVCSQPKDGEDFHVLSVPESGEMPNECLTNVTSISSTLGEHEEIDASLSSGAKVSGAMDSQAEETLSSISSINVETSSNKQLMFIKNSTHGSSRSHVELNDTKGTDLIETKNPGCSNIQPEMTEELFDSVPSEISVGNLGNKALTFTEINTEALNPSAVGDLNLNSTYSEFNFHQPTSLTLSLNTEHDRESSKSDEINSINPPRLKSGLEIQTIDISLGDIEVEPEQLGLLPSEILHEDNVNSPKLASVVSVCLEPSKTSEPGIDQPISEPEMIDFVALTSGNQVKFCSTVYDVIGPHDVSPSNDGTAESNMPLIEMHGVSKVLQVDADKCVTSGMALLNSDGKELQNQEVTCMESLLPVLKETSIELGGSGDSELCRVKNETQTSGGEPTKTEEGKNDNTFEVIGKLTSDVPESSTEHLLL
ncbi:zinc finger protein 318 [Pogona vitticeps]